MRIHPELDRLGYPLGSEGALYYATGIGGLVEASVDVSAARASSQNVVVTQDHLAHLRKLTEQRKRHHLRIVGKFGIPDNIGSLFSAKSMREVKRLSASLKLTENDLFLMIHNSRQLGFSCRSKNSSFVPDHLQITDSDWQSFKEGRVEQMPRKFFNLLRERKVINVHLFESGSQWHCFFFTYSDIDEVSENHWEGGPHIHYVSHIWPRLNRNTLWESLNRRRERASSGVHIKFDPFDWQPGDKKGSGFTDDTFFPIDAKLFKSGVPIPLALLSTRGVWLATFRVL